MLRPLCNNHQSSLPPNPLPNPSPPISFPFFFPKTLNPQNPKTRTKLLRASASSSSSTDTQTLPQSAIQRIADKLRSLGYADENDKGDPRVTLNPNSNKTSPGEIFVPLPNQLPKHRVGHSFDPSWSTPENPVPEPGSGNAIRRHHELRREVWREKVKRRAEGRENVPTLAELKLTAAELRRLRGIGLNKKLKIGKAGITEGIVNGIHERWRTTELVKIKCEDMSRLNMKRTHDLLERKTGGLVIWRSGSIIILYRGADYKYPYFFDDGNKTNDTSDSASLELHMDYGVHGEKETCSSGMDVVKSAGSCMSKPAQPPFIQGVGSPNRVRFQLPGEAQLVEEADHLLEGLGPRFTDWWGYDPLPVDGDLLPAIVPGHRRPFRLLPYGVKPKLTNDEMTTLRRLGRPLPCHFALSRNRKLQGLAASILKLWEKCEIAKIAVKRGVQNTNSELMTEELKWLTGGTVLSRDREYIILYRGKDFLPAAVSYAIEQRRKDGIHGLESRTDPSSSVTNTQEHKLGKMECASEDEHGEMNDQKRKVLSEQRKLRSSEAAIIRTSTKLSLTLEKKSRAEKLLEELEKEEIHQQPEIDKEGITEEERYMLRKVGLRMKPFLLLGRRGVFDGTVENMHLHWKYRELVKIISGERSVEEVQARARTLEAESGGILVAVERVSKGYAIIVYRGKNYKRPASLRPQTLLNKREALKRSIEAQRRESLKLHVLKLSRNVDELKLKLATDKETINKQSAIDMKLQLVKEQELDKNQSTEYKRSDTDLETCSARDRRGEDSTFFNTTDGTKASRDSLPATRRDMLKDFSVKYEDKDGDVFNIFQSEPLSESVLEETDVVMDMDDEGGYVESSITICPDDYKSQGQPSFSAIRDTEPLSESILEETDVVMDMDDEGGDVESSITICPDDYKSQGQPSFSAICDEEPHICNIKSKESSADSPKSEITVHRTVENGSDAIPSRATHLSNGERLLLRKQALKMKKRPVLAVGRSNVVTGVAKTIKTHFQKHPLAIVNVKGRAKGTSVKELVSKLEQATGAILVSQEPSKVILYRGWGAKEEPGQTNGKSTVDSTNTPTGTEGRARPVISPELMSAIRLECGLQCNQDDEAIA